MLLLEINEFNPDLMQQAANLLDAKNLRKVLSMHKTLTKSEDREERYGLDPWVQWVSIHTGKKSSEHGIRHLADLSKLNYPQIWETLGAAGYRCGIWGAMNARRGNGNNIVFFMTDPWTFDQPAHPEHLNHFLALPVYYAKNYGHTSKIEIACALLKTLTFLLRPSSLRTLAPLIPDIFSILCKEGLKTHILFVLFDLVNAALFIQHYKKYKPDFSILFLNSLAHLQHHKWSSKTELSPEMIVTFKIFDRVLETVFTGLKEKESIVIANSFTQVCSVDEKEFLYRQKSPEDFLHNAGIRFDHIEQLMTNDAHIFFNSSDDAISACELLKTAHLDGQKIFDVEYDKQFPTRIFYQLAFWKKVGKDAVLDISGKRLRFLDQFYCVTQRKGSHSPNGHVFSSKPDFPPEIYNYEIYRYILAAFNL